MAKTAKKTITGNQITVRNIENGITRKVGATFLDRQPKPYQGLNKLYANGVWVAGDSKPTKEEMSHKAKDIVAEAAKPVSNPLK